MILEFYKKMYITLDNMINTLTDFISRNYVLNKIMYVKIFKFKHIIQPTSVNRILPIKLVLK